ncbi:MAG: hypothetical protein N2234_04845 [Planctomycetota bacterium]|nr:hypothetical protein [Planctomycetota bacterium]
MEDLIGVIVFLVFVIISVIAGRISEAAKRRRMEAYRAHRPELPVRHLIERERVEEEGEKGEGVREEKRKESGSSEEYDRHKEKVLGISEIGFPLEGEGVGLGLGIGGVGEGRLTSLGGGEEEREVGEAKSGVPSVFKEMNEWAAMIVFHEVFSRRRGLLGR